MVQGPAQPPDAEARRETPPAEHPEARGFGSQRRWRSELVLLLALVVALPLGVLWGARGLAEAAALRLPPSMDEKLGRPSWEALRMSGQRCENPAAERYVRKPYNLKDLRKVLGELGFAEGNAS